MFQLEKRSEKIYFLDVDNEYGKDAVFAVKAIINKNAAFYKVGEYVSFGISRRCF